MVSCSKASIAPLAHPSIPPHSRGSSPRSDCASTHGHPAQIHRETLQSLCGFGRSLERRKVEVFEDGIGGDPLNTDVKDLTSDILGEWSKGVMV